jgi:hypothetical protein
MVKAPPSFSFRQTSPTLARVTYLPRRPLSLFLLALLLACGSAGARTPATPAPALPIASPAIIISVPDQRLALIENQTASIYPISTSKFGLGDGAGSYKTPLGRLRVCQKIGDRLPLGAVLKGRFPTGEVLKPNAPGRDPIVTRILWLEGLDPENSHAFDREIYIHGTPEEARLGEPVSYGCIRMRSQDVALLFERCPLGVEVRIVNAPLGPLLEEAVPRVVPTSPEHPFLELPFTLAEAPRHPRRLWFHLTLGGLSLPPTGDLTDWRCIALLGMSRDALLPLDLRAAESELESPRVARTP